MEIAAVLNKNLFLVKEHIGMFKASNNFDIFDLENGKMIMTCREPNLSFFTKLFRFTDYKRMTPFEIEIKDEHQNILMVIKRGITLFRSDVEVFDGKNQLLGIFKQKIFSVGGKFEVFDKHDRPLCTLKGKWTGWDFSFLDKNNAEIAHVSKKWAGIGKEFFTSADNYVIEIRDRVAENDPIRYLIIATVMCIDMVLKE
ncbi:phospholipid scramblase family protein [Flavobacterium sp. NRK F10]|uniref:phospholipid scramblase family protein n=1 Tax=Flavobacterium sp. NRK F10 TaxID=2954931 RepID=UPI00209032B6|nr:phospholipid scramblase family protein [Flavobacterium sp. NRK F10]MCO6175471.1 phospholipid scramblase family protein [Flavobacterium sp. NRK F10]